MTETGADVDISAMLGRFRGGRGWVPGVTVVVITSVVAVVAASTGSDGPPAIRLAGLHGDGNVVAETARADDMAIWNPVVQRFELTGGARFPAGDAPVWRLDPPADLGAAATRLARSLGLDDPVPTAHERGAYQAGPDDGSGPGLWVGPTGDWHYHVPSSHSYVCAEPAFPDEQTDGAASSRSRPTGLLPDVEACPEPEPPAGVPDADGARRAAERFLAGLDLDLEPTVADVHADEWSAWVSAGLQVDDRATDVHFSVAFGAEGAVTSASGTLANAVPVDRYRTVDAETAVERLAAQGEWLRGGTTAVVDLPLQDGPAVDPAGPESHGAELEEVTVRLVDAEPALSITLGVDGVVWLLPAVRFIDDQGGVWPVLVIDEDHVEFADHGSGVGGPEPAPEPVPVDPPAAEPPAEPTDPEEPPEPTTDHEALARSVIGLAEDEAIARIEEQGGTARIVMRDGEGYPVTDDLRSDRINLVIEDDRVVDAKVG